MRYNLFIELLKKQLKSELPGEIAQQQMSPPLRMQGVKLPIDESKAIKSAVLLLLFPINEIPHFVLIKRIVDNGPHSGQISFPGGKYESQDRNISHTAIRETYEEIGIQEADIEIIGSLSSLFVPVSNFIIYPLVGTINYKPTFKISKSEVNSLIITNLNDFFHNKSTTYGKFVSNNTIVEAPFYYVKDNRIWGATAMILSEFFEIYSNIKF